MSLEAYIYKMMNKLGVSIEEWGSILQEKKRCAKSQQGDSPNLPGNVQILEICEIDRETGQSEVLNFIHTITSAIQREAIIGEYQAKSSDEENVGYNLCNEYGTQLEVLAKNIIFFIDPLLISKSEEQYGW